jgi:NADP-dependent 3-hydroxy acid dehydrogenase YdfG
MITKPLVVITGASSGIGQATAKIFAENGYPLVVISRKIEKIPGAQTDHIIYVEASVGDIAVIEKAINDAEQQYGAVDCLINNAGVLHLGNIGTQPLAELQEMLDTNVMGTIICSSLIVNKMKENRQGTIINISSVAGRKSIINHAGYCATKGAVHLLTETIREEVAPYNVRCVTIAPGIVDTDLMAKGNNVQLKKDYVKWKQDNIQAPLTAEDVAQVIWMAYNQPKHVCLREIVLAPTEQIP